MKFNIPKDWIESRAHLEEGHEIGAGSPPADCSAYSILRITIQFLLLADGLIAGIPQILRMLERGSSEDVSIATWGWMFFMACAWAWQGKRDASAMTFWGSIVWAVNNASVVVVAVILRGAH